MKLQTFSTTVCFSAGALVLVLLLWTFQPGSIGSLMNSDESTSVGLMAQAVVSAGLSGLFVDGLRFLAHVIWPAKKKPKFALRHVLDDNLTTH